MGSSTQTTKSTQKQESSPYAPVQPLIKGLATGAESYINDPNASAVYSGQRTVPISAATQSGIDTLAAGAGAGASQDYLKKVLAGDYLNSGNPNIQGVLDAIRAQVAPQVNSTFSNAGLANSTLHQGMLAKALTQGYAQPLFANYEAERARQDAAAGLLPQIETQAGRNAVDAGQIGEGYTQRQLDAARALFEEQRTAGLKPLSEALPFAQLGGLGGTASSQGTDVTKSKQPLGNMIGGGLLTAAGILGAPFTGGASLGLTGIGSSLTGAPSGYGSSWAPWVRYGA